MGPPFSFYQTLSASMPIFPFHIKLSLRRQWMRTYLSKFYDRYFRLSGVFLLLLCAACVAPDRDVLKKSGNNIVLLNPESGLGDDWEHRRLRRADTSYETVETGLGHTIRATGNQSASILYRLFEPTGPECNRLRWSWFVQNPQPGSDLHSKGRDDVAASVFVMFGDPGIFQDNPVPTLKYAWANSRHQKDEIIVGPYQEKYIRTWILRAGGSTARALVTETVNLREDYLTAFGEAPENGVYGVALFTDNDDTREPIVAHYGKIELLCNE